MAFDQTAPPRPYADLPLAPPAFGAVRLRDLVALRWCAAAGQMATVLVVSYGLGFDLPLTACLAAIGASVLVNLAVMARLRMARLARRREAAAHLGFDIAQLAFILGLTGGLANPFCVILVAPVVIAGATLPGKYALPLALFAIVCTGLMAVWAHPLPWHPNDPFILPGMYVFALWTALIIAMAFAGLTAWRAAAEAGRTARALAATQAVLAREQRLAAIGGLAAAAAHELGTPLATIQLTAKEMARELGGEGALADDARLLVSQAERCRDILAQLSRRGDEDDAALTQSDFDLLLEEIAAPFDGLGKEIVTRLEGEGDPPVLHRTPEILYGVGNLVENAVDFAASTVEIAGGWTHEEIWISVADDGPGYDPEILAKLGEPYVTTRRGGDESGGMGLGVFIAETLLARTGGELRYENSKGAGARCIAVWPRSAIDASYISPSRRSDPI